MKQREVGSEVQRRANDVLGRLQDEADRRGHGTATRGAAIGGGLGAAFGSFGGLWGAVFGAGVGALIGFAIGSEFDPVPAVRPTRA